jgi:hypothetical protein
MVLKKDLEAGRKYYYVSKQGGIYGVEFLSEKKGEYPFSFKVLERVTKNTNHVKGIVSAHLKTTFLDKESAVNFVIEAHLKKIEALKKI